MKILFLQDDFPPQSFGGAGIVAYQLAKSLHDLGHTVAVITVVHDKSDVGCIEYHGLQVYKIYSNYHERWRAYFSVYNPYVVHKVRRIIEEFSPDVVHAHNIHSHLSYSSVKISKKSGAKVFLTAHDVMLFHYGKLFEYINPKNPITPEAPRYTVSSRKQMQTYRLRYNPLRNICIRYYLRYVDKIFAVSEALRDALIQNGIPKVEVIHNGIDVKEWSVDRTAVSQFKHNYHLEHKKIILFGGRLSAGKGAYQSLLMLSEVVKKIPNAILLVMGKENQYRKQLDKEIKALGIGEQILFTGWISGDTLKACYASADVVVVPSIYLDPFPTITLEAMASGKAVVVTCHGGTRELVVDGVTGYVINPHDIESFSQAVVKVLNDTICARTMGEAGKKRIQELFSLQKQTEKIVSWYYK